MSAAFLEQVATAWYNFSKFVHVLHNEQDYRQAVELLESLIDVVGENEQHPLASLDGINRYFNRKIRGYACTGDY